MKRLTVRLKGGLGNQLFQYACAYSYSKLCSLNLYLDSRSGFLNDSKYRREYLLDNFNLYPFNEAGSAHSYLSCFGKSRRYFDSFAYSKKYLCSPYHYIFENTPHVPNPHLFDFTKPTNTYLDGCWQSPLYFYLYEDDIVSQFQPIVSLSSDSQFFLDLISRSNNPVCLGIRRYSEVDAASRSILLSQGVIPSSHFYRRAINRISQTIDSPRYFVFTLDVDWAKSNLSLPVDTVFIPPGSNNKDSIQDFYLMMHCNHYIISYSSFYWWAAYLSKNRTYSSVFVPDLGSITRFFYPPFWTLL